MVNQKINTYAYKLGFIPNLDDWLTELRTLINNYSKNTKKKILSPAQKKVFLASIDALFFLYNNGTYYEVDKENKAKISAIKNELIHFFDTQDWNEEEQELLYQVYLHSF
ncbi:hypothetical protein [Psychrobacter sp. I-STPA10]|uniref:hypothetical protein n=1 Tax=Psychrobacter sp. I-STPA10 TaxID=2585769 RepID=UPI001E61E28F|nr:hypothetical protein [Psychrobacter sp. I-STPA10]